MTESQHKALAFTQSDCEILSREIMYKGVFRLVRYKMRYQLFSGGWSEPVEREVLERLSAAAILPYDPELDRVVLIEQFRPGALGHSHSPWLVEIVAGVLDANEPPSEVAIREAQEEAGCIVSALAPIHDFFVSPGGSNEYLNIYCGKIDSRNIGGVHGLAHEQEDIRAYTLTFDEAMERLNNGYIKTAPAIIALQWLQINRQSLRKLWREPH